MKKTIFLSAIALTVASSLSFATTLNSLNKSQVSDTVSDKTITSIPLITLDSTLVQNTFTGYFGKDGKLAGQLSTQPGSGPQTDTGTWKVNADGTLCATWQHWNNSTPVCVSIFKLDNGLLLVNSKSKKFETLLLSTDIKTGNQLN